MRILEKIGAYFEGCSESFASEGQVVAMLHGSHAAGAKHYRRLVLARREALGS
jgi:hypothetical protein